jgi:hypothetical protein
VSLIALAWILSLTAAAAFLTAGYLLGRRGLATAQGVLANQKLPEPPTPPELSTAPIRPELVSPPVRVRPKTVDVRFLEGRLVQSLRKLDPEQRLSQLVICDESGLPIAAADHIPAGGLAEDPVHLSALAAEALSLTGRVGQMASTSGTVKVELTGQRQLEVRPIAGLEPPLFLVTIGGTLALDGRLEAFALEVKNLFDPSH